MEKIEKSSNTRQTSLQDAIIDVFIAKEAMSFLGTDASSYSELIETLIKC